MGWTADVWWLSLDVKTYGDVQASGCNPDDASLAESADREDVEGASLGLISFSGPLKWPPWHC